MISNISNWHGINLDNNLHLFLTKDTLIGQRLKRMNSTERAVDRNGNAISEVHPSYPFLIKLDVQYFILEGSVKVRYEWKDGDVFQNEHKEQYSTIVLSNSPEHTRMQSNFTHGDGFMQGMSSMGTEATDWKDNPILYEPHCSITEITILEDNTRILCPMEYDKGWTFKKSDVLPGTTVTATKDGTNCYIFFGQDCEVNGVAVEKNKTKELTSNSVSIKNVSSKLCRLVKIYK